MRTLLEVPSRVQDGKAKGGRNEEGKKTGSRREEGAREGGVESNGSRIRREKARDLLKGGSVHSTRANVDRKKASGRGGRSGWWVEGEGRGRLSSNERQEGRLNRTHFDLDGQTVFLIDILKLGLVIVNF